MANIKEIPQAPLDPIKDGIVVPDVPEKKEEKKD